ncbi:hypothetical protein GCM10025760_30930 [Microbacterium yannicii]|uniref:Fimbrial assembly protein n=1 Tax=Microbacterium yannicii TaxID=671622 RepID=A0ABP9MLF8_9MICO|nr:hypothetical protein [Microbacterium yannicii]MCO5951572.1 hypothetical protein [Microbacterium yannicii]
MARGAPTTTLSGIPRVDLTPRVEIQRRDRARILRAWGWALVAALIALLVILAVTLYLNWVAVNELAAEQARTDALLTESAELSEVSVALGTQRDLEDFRADAMASELDWSSLYATLNGVLPAGAVMTAFDLEVGGAPLEDEEPTEQTGLRGQLTVTSPTPVEIAGLIRAYRALPGVIGADGWEVSSSAGDGVYTNQLTIEFDQSVYTGAYAGGQG